MDYEWIEKNHLKKSDEKTKKKQKINVKLLLGRTKKWRYVILILTKNEVQNELWMDWENNLEKNPIQKIEKTVKIRVKLPHVNKKQPARKRFVVQTPFSHSTLKLERKKFTPKNHSLFRSISCFGVTKITTPIWLQKSWKCVNRS